MAITISGSNVLVAGAYDFGTSTGTPTAAAMVLIDGTKNFTGVVGRHLFITSGIYAGASGVITFNSGGNLYTNMLAWFNPATKSFENVVVPPGSSYRIGYTYFDCVTQQPTAFSWDDATNKQVLKCNKGLYIQADGALGNQGRSLIFTVDASKLEGAIGAFFQTGYLDSNFSGVDGGSIEFQMNSAIYREMVFSGYLHLYGSYIAVHKAFVDSTNAEYRWNNSVTNSGSQKMIDVITSRLTVAMRANDVFKNVRVTKNRFNIKENPLLVDNSSTSEGNVATGGTLGVNGGDVFSFAFSGKTNVGAFQSNIGMFSTALPKDVIYFHDPDFKKKALSAVVDWYPGVNDAPVHITITASVAVSDTSNAALSAVAIGVINSVDGTGQLITAKDISANNYAPITKRVVQSDINGNYIGQFGSNKGLFVRRALLTNSGTRAVSTVVDYSPYTLMYIKYGYFSQSYPRNWNYETSNSEKAFLRINPYVSATFSAAMNYLGIAVDGVLKTITLSGTLTAKQVYEYTQAWRYNEAVANDAIYDEPLKTSDGQGYSLAPGWLLIISTPLAINITGNVNVTAIININGLNVFGAVNFTVAGTYTLTNCTINEVINTSAGNVIINVTGVTSITTNTGPNITINNTKVFTVIGLIAGSIVEIYDNEIVNIGNNDTLLASTQNSGTSFAYTHNGATNAIRVQVLKTGYIEEIHDFSLSNVDQSLSIKQGVDLND